MQLGAEHLRRTAQERDALGAAGLDLEGQASGCCRDGGRAGTGGAETWAATGEVKKQLDFCEGFERKSHRYAGKCLSQIPSGDPWACFLALWQLSLV